MTNNLDVWNKLSRPPKEALKQIQAGRLKGKSDINPQWRYKVMTDVFGICGNGWKYSIDKLWTEAGLDGQIFAFAQVSLIVSGHDPIPGIGGSMLLAKERDGIHHNDEAFKMAVTDALGTAMKMLGVAADIYMGLWDGSKYRDMPTTGITASHKHLPTDGAWESMSDAQQKRLLLIAKKVEEHMAENNIEFAVNILKGNEMTNEEKTALWTRFDSATRTAINAAMGKGSPKRVEELRNAVK